MGFCLSFASSDLTMGRGQGHSCAFSAQQGFITPACPGQVDPQEAAFEDGGQTLTFGLERLNLLTERVHTVLGWA